MQRLEFIEDSGDLKNLNEKYLEQGWKVKDFIHGTSSSRFPVGLVLIESQQLKLIDTLKKTTDENSDSDNSLNAIIDPLFE